MTPIYFGTNNNLLGILHPASKEPANRSLIICQPPLSETLYSHWTLLNIARQSAAIGYNVLRFDLSGMGNSIADSSSIQLDDWINDIHDAIDLIDNMYHANYTTILGVRFTFSIIAQVSLQRDFEKLIGWDPILTGKSWISEYKNENEIREKQSIEIQGYKLDKKLIKAINEFHINTIDCFSCNSVFTKNYNPDNLHKQLGMDWTKTTEDYNWIKPLQNIFFANESISKIIEFLK